MTSMRGKINKLAKKRKYLFGLIFICIFAIVFGIRAVSAYYFEETSIQLLASLVGNFDVGSGDINIIIYRENDDGGFTPSYAVPSAYYTFDDTKTSCTIPCQNNGTGSCSYNYNSSTKNFNLVSNEKVTCKFYFKKSATSDINVYILKEDINGKEPFNGKNYTLVDNVPAFGYKYATYNCDNTNAQVTFDSNTKKFNVLTGNKSKCNAYFDSEGDADIIANIYLQTAPDSSLYNAVETIPSGRAYKLSTQKASSCNGDGQISYDNGYVSVNDATHKQECEIYLDIVS